MFFYRLKKNFFASKTVKWIPKHFLLQQEFTVEVVAIYIKIKSRNTNFIGPGIYAP